MRRDIGLSDNLLRKSSRLIAFLSLPANSWTRFYRRLLSTIDLHVLLFYSTRPPAFVARIRTRIGTWSTRACAVLTLLMLHGSALSGTAHMWRISTSRKVEMSLCWRRSNWEVPNTRSPRTRWVLLLWVWIIIANCSNVFVECSIRWQ